MVFDKIKTSKILQFQLDKMEISGIRAQVGFAMDVSGSMSYLYKNGYMQLFNNRIYPIAEKFDDNQSMDVCIFDDQAIEMIDMDASNYQDYIEKEIINSDMDIWGGTYYEPAISIFVKKWFGNSNLPKTKIKKGLFSKLFGSSKEEEVENNNNEKISTIQKIPSYLIFQTDGENFDANQTKAMIEKLKNFDMFISFVGVGNESFNFIRELSEQYENVGFFHIADIKNISDEEIYEGLITEKLSSWLKNAVITID